MIVAERFRADESGFAETGASHTKRLLVAMLGALDAACKQKGGGQRESGDQTFHGEPSLHGGSDASCREESG
jgi:hypothetical protein